MITSGKKSHYLVVTILSALFQGKSSSHDEDFYCLNYHNSYIYQKINLKNMKKYAIITIAVV